MNVFDYAMKMEQDGKAFYEKHAAKQADAGLKKILLELAADEDKHYHIFKGMRDGKAVKYDEKRKTTILTSVKNVFEKMQAGKKEFSFPADARNVWVEAREIEKKSETFYREKAGEVKDAGQKTILVKIADEEHKHWITMENVIQFMDRPKTWLENAEWSHLEEY